MINQNSGQNLDRPALGGAEHIGGLTCAEFQEQLPELLAAGGNIFSNHPHLLGCANCSALVRDLEYIADAARQLLPAHDPSPDVWNQIQSSMQRESTHSVEEK